MAYVSGSPRSCAVAMDTESGIPTDANDNISKDYIHQFKGNVDTPCRQSPVSRSSVDNHALLKSLNNNNNDIYTSHTSVNNLPHLSQYFSHQNIEQLAGPKSGAHPIGYQYVPVIVYSDGSMRPIDMSSFAADNPDLVAGSGSAQLASIASKIASSMLSPSYQMDPDLGDADAASDSSSSSNNDGSPSSDDTAVAARKKVGAAIDKVCALSTKSDGDEATETADLGMQVSPPPLVPLDGGRDEVKKDEDGEIAEGQRLESLDSTPNSGTDSLVNEIRGKAQAHYAEKGEIVYKCDKCDSAFSTPVFLHRHRKFRHALDDNYPFQKNAKQICLPSSSDSPKTSATSVLEKKIAALNRRAASQNPSAATSPPPAGYTGSDQHRCLMCGLEFTTSKDLTDHVVQHSKQLSEEQVFPDPDEILAESTRSEAFSCHLCVKTFHTKHQLKSHIRAHGVRDILECGSCAFSTNEFDILYQHISVHTDGSAVKCKACVRTFKLICHLKFHVRHVHPDQAVDSTWYPHQGLLRRPQSTSTSSNLSDSPLPDNGGVWRCTYCNKAFEKASNLQLHVRIHTGEKPYICSYCGHRFTLPGDLKRHTRIHTGEKPYMCMYCDKRFNRHDNLKSHAKVHAKR